ncbi:hypothetical protein [Methylobacterium planeticum]|uniref:Uncharacterized protein n=1 Tax=Methylobacterium planeticum TaxID=2615211 RepID=A0A6N6MHE2_9HYPH|nr:hypothetical protein [Methylobacterium planeticum]KAB1068866.1 hypothetical protein F6X51_26035 [Methylobacterium planeticum]
MAGKSRFTPEQEAHILSLAGDRKALRAAYPGVPTSTLRSVLARNKAPKIKHAWSAEDSALVEEHYPDYRKLLEVLPDRKIYALRRRAQDLGLSTGKRRNGGGRAVEWTPEQIDLVKIWGTLKHIPGKSYSAARSFRYRNGICTTPPPGYGEVRQQKRERIAARAAERARETAHRNAMARLRTGPRPIEAGADMLAAVRRLVSRNERHRADDLTGEAVILLLTGEADTPARAVRQAAVLVNRMHPTHGRDITWDTPVFGGAGLTLADTIGAWP